MNERRDSARSNARRWTWRRAWHNFNVLTECEDDAAGRRNAVHRVFCYVRRLSEAFATHQCSLLACACAYCAILSLIPLLVVSIALFGFVMGNSQDALEQVLSAIRGYVPIEAGFLRDTLARILKDRGLIGAFGIVGLLYAAHQTFLSMLPAMNIIWVTPETRHWAKQRLLAFGATFLTLALLGADLVASGVIAFIQTQPDSILSHRLPSLLARGSLGLLPVVSTTLLFALLYRSLPARQVPWKAALIGAGVAAALWQLTKLAFVVFLRYVHSYDRLYGSLSSLVILVVWIYYSMVILLLGAEIAADYNSARKGLHAAEERAHSGADLMAAHGNTSVHPAQSGPADFAEGDPTNGSAPLEHDGDARRNT